MICGQVLSAQVIMSSNKKAVKLFEKGKKYVEDRQFEEAIVIYNEAIQKDSLFAEAYLNIASAYNKLNLAKMTMPYYIELAKRFPEAPRYISSHLKLAAAAFANGEYKVALIHSEKYLSLKTKEDIHLLNAQNIRNNCQFALTRIESPMLFNPRPLPAPLNKFKQQYFPVLTADSRTLYFIKRDKDEEIYTSTRMENNGWSAPIPIDSAIVSEYNEGTCTISADGRTLVFTSCMRKDGYGSCDLYITYKTGEKWSTPKNMGRTINSGYWDSQPALSADGRRLYYVSNRTGGIGNRDIWLTNYSDEGGWSSPVNLGSGINTEADDISPFIHANDQTLFFATNGRPGFGGFDIYYTERNEEENWLEPLNFGFPINTHNDELAMFITADGAHGYYSHEVNENELESKLYIIDIPRTISVKHRSSYISGIIVDSLTNKPLKASIMLFKLLAKEGSDNKAITSKTNSDAITGKYLMVLTEGASYGLYISAPNYLFKSYHFNLENDSIGLAAITANIGLLPIKNGEKTTLNNVLFEHASFALSKKSKSALIYVSEYLQNYPDLNIEIAGFTDSIGDKDYNLVLSNDRAKSVYDYLVANGVDDGRIGYRGYGSSYPIASNLTETGRSKNRRIELIILE